MANYPPNVSNLFVWGGIYVFPRNCLGIPHRTNTWIDFRTGMVKSKLKNLILSLMALHAEMRGLEREEMWKIIEELKKLAEKIK